MLQFYPETIGVIPLKDSLRHETLPWVSALLSAAILSAFAADRYTSGIHQVQVPTLAGLIEVPASIGGLSARYALVPEAFVRAPGAHWHTIATASLLHSNLVHACANVLCLWLFGRGLESVLGRRFVALVFAAGAILGNLAQAYACGLSDTPVVGATGAVAALIGAHLVACRGVSFRSFVPVVFLGTLLDTPPLLVAGLWVLVSLANAHLFRAGDMVYGGGVALHALAAGLAVGLAAGLLLRRRAAGRLSDLRVDD